MATPSSDPARDSLLARLYGRIAGLFSGGGFASRYSTALMSQAMVSGFHFVLNVMLLRTLEAKDYGIFALAFVLAVIGSSVGNALVSMPLSVYTPGVKRRARRIFTETLLSTVSAMLVLVVWVAGFAFTAFLDISIGTALAFAAFVALYTARQYTRSFGFARRAPAVPVFGDFTYVVVGAVILVIEYFAGSGISLLTTFVALSVGNLAAALMEMRLLHTGIRLIFRRRSLARYLEIWKEVKWALLGVVTTMLQTQAHSFIVSVAVSTAAYAPLAAGAVLFAPVRIGLQAWQNIMRPEIVVAISEQRKHSVQRTIRLSTWGMVAALAVLGGLIAVFWEPIFELLYKEKYSDAPMGWIVAGWTAITLFSALSTIPSGVLQALREFRPLSFAAVYGSIISLLAVAVLLYLYTPATSLFGTLLAEVFVAGFVMLLARKKIKQQL